MSETMSARGGSAFGGKKQSVTSSILWLMLAEIFFNFSGYIIHAVLGRLLGPADYGRYGLIVTLTTMIVMLIGNGIPTAMSKYLSAVFETRPEMVLVIKRKAAFLQAILIGTVTVVFFLLAPVFSFFLNDPTLTPLFQLSSLIIPSFAAASFYLYYYIGLHCFNLQSTLKTVRSFARIAFVIGLAYLFGVKGSVAAYIFAPATVFVTAFFIDRFRIDRQFRTSQPVFFDWRKLINYAWPVTLFMLFYELLISLDLYFVKALLSDDHLTGIYNASLTVARIPYYLFYALTLVMLPTVSRTTSQEDHAETNRIVSRTFRLMIIILMPMVLLMIVFAAPLIQLFFGARFLEAVRPMQILSAGIGFLTIFYVLSFALNGAGKAKIPMYLSLGGMILNAVLNYFLILRFGLIGSALATSLVSVIITAAIFFPARTIFGNFISLKGLFRTTLSGAGLLMASLLFPATPWIFIIWSLILSAIYLAILVLIKEVTADDYRLFLHILKRKPLKKQPIK